MFVSPVTVHVPDRGDPVSEVALQVNPPGFEVTWNDVGVPPVALSVTVTSTAAFWETPVGCRGALGAAGCGVTDEDAAEELLVPNEFVAVALNV